MRIMGRPCSQANIGKTFARETQYPYLLEVQHPVRIGKTKEGIGPAARCGSRSVEEAALSRKVRGG